jgi:c-di-GMP-binding flagellar brake protein YcgR
MSMETQPMPLEELSKAPGGLEDFRITAPSEIAGYLKKLCAGSVTLNLVGPDGPGYVTTVWAVDTDRGNVVFSADLTDADLQRILRAGDSVIVGYLDAIKLQFDASGLVVAREGRTGALNLRMPREMYRFQRRDAYRVKPLPRAAPSAHMRHPEARDRPLELRVLDLSMGGCALLAPGGTPTLVAGMSLPGVHIDLDGQSTVRGTLLLRHVAPLDDSNADGLPVKPGSVRVGCELLDMSPECCRVLQRFIDQTQQRRRNVMSF